MFFSSINLSKVRHLEGSFAASGFQAANVPVKID
jgi:hypothetical protein